MTTTALPEKLTDKEMAVVRLLADGLIEAMARELALSVDRADPTAEDWASHLTHWRPLAERLHQVYAPALDATRKLLRQRNKEYGRASAEVGALRAQLTHTHQQRRAQAITNGRLADDLGDARRLLQHFGAVTEVDGAWCSRCWLCGQVDQGWTSEIAAWGYLDHHWREHPSGRCATAAGRARLAHPEPPADRTRVLVDGVPWKRVGHSQMYGESTWRPVVEHEPAAPRAALWSELTDGRVVQVEAPAITGLMRTVGAVEGAKGAYVDWPAEGGDGRG